MTIVGARHVVRAELFRTDFSKIISGMISDLEELAGGPVEVLRIASQNDGPFAQPDGTEINLFEKDMIAVVIEAQTIE